MTRTLVSLERCEAANSSKALLISVPCPLVELQISPERAQEETDSYMSGIDPFRSTTQQSPGF